LLQGSHLFVVNSVFCFFALLTSPASDAARFFPLLIAPAAVFSATAVGAAGCSGVDSDFVAFLGSDSPLCSVEVCGACAGGACAGGACAGGACAGGACACGLSWVAFPFFALLPLAVGVVAALAGEAAPLAGVAAPPAGVAAPPAGVAAGVLAAPPLPFVGCCCLLPFGCTSFGASFGVLSFPFFCFLINRMGMGMHINWHIIRIGS